MHKNEEKFIEDTRYKQCTKEMFIVLVFGVVNFSIIAGLSMGIGLNKEAEEVRLVLGFPDWFFWGGFIGSTIVVILTILIVKFLFKDMSISEKEDDS